MNLRSHSKYRSWIPERDNKKLFRIIFQYGGYRDLRFPSVYDPGKRVEVVIPALIGKVKAIPHPVVQNMSTVEWCVNEDLRKFRDDSRFNEKVIAGLVDYLSVFYSSVEVKSKWVHMSSSRPVYGGMYPLSSCPAVVKKFSRNNSFMNKLSDNNIPVGVKFTNSYFMKKAVISKSRSDFIKKFGIGKETSPFIKGETIPSIKAVGFSPERFKDDDVNFPKPSGYFSNNLLSGRSSPLVYIPNFKSSGGSLYPNNISKFALSDSNYYTYNPKSLDGPTSIVSYSNRTVDGFMFPSPEPKRISYMHRARLKQFYEKSLTGFVKPELFSRKFIKTYNKRLRRRVVSHFKGRKNKFARYNRWHLWSWLSQPEEEDESINRFPKYIKKRRKFYKKLKLDRTYHSKDKVSKSFHHELLSGKVVEDLIIVDGVWTSKSELSPSYLAYLDKLDKEKLASTVNINTRIKPKNFIPYEDSVVAPFPYNVNIFFNNVWVKELYDRHTMYPHIVTNYDSPWSLPHIKHQHKSILFGDEANDPKSPVTFQGLKYKYWRDWQQQDYDAFKHGHNVKSKKRIDRLGIIPDSKKHPTSIMRSYYSLPDNTPGDYKNFMMWYKATDYNPVSETYGIYDSVFSRFHRRVTKVRISPLFWYTDFSFPSSINSFNYSIADAVIDLAFPLPDEYSLRDMNYLSKPFALQKVETVGSIDFDKIHNPIHSNNLNLHSRQFIYPSSYHTPYPRKEGQVVSYEDQLAFISHKVIETIESDYEDGLLDSNIYYSAKKKIRYDVFYSQGFSKVLKKRGYDITVSNSKLNLTPKSMSLDDQLYHFGREIYSLRNLSVIQSSAFPLEKVVQLMFESFKSYEFDERYKFIFFYAMKFGYDRKKTVEALRKGEPGIVSMFRDDIRNIMKDNIFFLIDIRGSLISDVEDLKKERKRLSLNPTLTLSFNRDGISSLHDRLSYLPVSDEVKELAAKSIITNEGVSDEFIHKNMPSLPVVSGSPKSNFLGTLFELGEHPSLIANSWLGAIAPHLKNTMEVDYRYRNYYQRAGHNFTEASNLGSYPATLSGLDNFLEWRPGVRGIHLRGVKRYYKRQVAIHRDYIDMYGIALKNFFVGFIFPRQIYDKRLNFVKKIHPDMYDENPMLYPSENRRSGEVFSREDDYSARLVLSNLYEYKVGDVVHSSMRSLSYMVDNVSVSDVDLYEIFESGNHLSTKMALSGVSIIKDIDVYCDFTIYLRNEFLSHCPSYEDVISVIRGRDVVDDLVPYYLFKLSILKKRDIINDKQYDIIRKSCFEGVPTNF